MKGFVPVSKADLLTMLCECKEMISYRYFQRFDQEIASYIESEKERISERKWYRLWLLPKAQFEFTEKGVLEYAKSFRYGLLEANPFKTLKNSRKSSEAWVESLEAIAESQYAGEPIQIDIQTFKRISRPNKHMWVSTNWTFRIN